MFRGFEEAGVRWCFLRVPADLGAPAGDIDLLIGDADIGRAREVVRALGFVPVPRPGMSLHYLHYDSPTAQWLWIHMVTEMNFGPFEALRTGAEAGCLARRCWEGPIAVLAPDDAFWALLLHCVVDTQRIPPRHRTRLQELVGAARADGVLARMVAGICPPGWTPERMMECVGRGAWTTLEEVGPPLTVAWLRHHSIGRWGLLSRRVAWAAKRLLSRPRARGISVALLGPDGAGKTTLAAAIERSFVFPVRLVYMGLTGGQLPRVARLRVTGLVMLGRLCVFWARYLRARYHQARGRLVVFDRYLYDAAVPTPIPLGWLGRLSRWVDGHACPGPDLVLLLDAPGAVMHARKGEYTPEMLEGWRQRFLALRQRVRQLEVVDATRAQSEVHADVIDRIWRRYAARWGGR